MMVSVPLHVPPTSPFIVKKPIFAVTALEIPTKAKEGKKRVY